MPPAFPGVLAARSGGPRLATASVEDEEISEEEEQAVVRSKEWFQRVVFDSVRAKLLLESDVFWARASIGHNRARSNFQILSKTRYCGTGAAVIRTGEQMLHAQQCIGSLRRILLEVRKVHSRQDYEQREQEILGYLSRNLEQPVAS